jgi:glucose-1-phosphate thymidylyltransferase
MAGRGTRLRPHTLTTPKPLVPVAGTPIIERLVNDLSDGFKKPFDTIAFVIGDPGDDAKMQLRDIASNVGAKARFFRQEQPLGPAHAIYCASECLHGPCIIAFADTLFKADFKIPENADGTIWVHQVKNPSSYGVVTTNDAGVINAFVEKPDTFVSDQAIVGIYYLKEGEVLRDEIEKMIKNEIREKGEYQITTALDSLRKKGVNFKPAIIEEWLDCGNKEALVYANMRILAWQKDNIVSQDTQIINSQIIPPCRIGRGVEIRNSIVGPYVTAGDGVFIERALVENSILQNDSRISGVNINKSLIGRHAHYSGKPSELNLGDYSNMQL